MGTWTQKPKDGASYRPDLATTNAPSEPQMGVNNFPAQGLFSKPSTLAVALLGVLIAWKVLSEAESTVFKPSDIGVTVPNILTVTLMALIGIPTAKYLALRYFPSSPATLLVHSA